MQNENKKKQLSKPVYIYPKIKVHSEWGDINMVDCSRRMNFRSGGMSEEDKVEIDTKDSKCGPLSIKQ